MNSKKLTVDLITIAASVVTIVTGIILHIDVHHLHVYDDVLLWGTHEIAGTLMFLMLVFHCLQHKFWFTNYLQLTSGLRTGISLMAIAGLTVFATGLILYCGSHSRIISLTHYISGILFFVAGVIHIIVRRQLLAALFGKEKHTPRHD